MHFSKIPPQSRTTLVNVFGWVMLVSGVLMTLVMILNLVLLVLASQADGVDMVSPDGLPAMATWLLDNMVAVGIVMILSGAAMAAAGFGVVRRREWGRQLSIILLALSILWAVGGGIMGLVGTDSMMGAENDSVGPILMAVNIGSMLLTLALHGWLIWKLRTVEVRGEFVESPSESF